MKRNPDATCGNCPYLDNAGGKWMHNNIESGYCAKDNDKRYIKGKSDWCGQHPEFWMEEQEENDQ